ncbi:MAG: chorismate-binding protein [Flavobacteriaceae bacterium]|nr:chorismate-binding protein [Flavobacteriaceae bacterium]
MKFEKDFVVFRLPDTDFIQVANLTEFIENKAYFIFHSFDNQTSIKFGLKQLTQFSWKEFDQIQILPELLMSDFKAIDNEKELYLHRCHHFINEIKKNNFGKLILSRRVVKPKFENLQNQFVALCEKYPSAFTYLIHFDNETWIGASPERLVQKRGNQLKTVALASTKAISENRDWTSKELKEHQIVVDYIAKNLQDLNLQIRPTATIEVGQIQHLITHISGTFNSEKSLEQVCSILHPTPAVCGIPKEEAQDFIIQNEGYPRRFYTGYYGYVDPNAAEIFVNLRCAQLFQNQNIVYVGGGLLAESEPEKEWEETVWKSHALYV